MKLITVFIIVFVLFISCKKFVQVDPPVNQVISTTLFSNDQGAISALSGLYYKISGTTSLGICTGGLSIFSGLTADEIYNTSSNPSYDPFTLNSIPANESTTIYGRFWTPTYSIIYEANAILEALDQSSNISSPVRQQITGETKFIRALCYFYLANVFGDVPLELTTDYRANSKMARTSTELIYQQLILDLQDAVNLLPATYPSAARARANKWAATSLLARLYLYKNDWENAEKYATDVISSGTYSLEQNLNNVFLAGSNETIWQITRTNANTFEGQLFIPASLTIKPTFGITNYLINTFEVNDKRFSNWLGSNTISSQTYYFPHKYKVRSSTTVTENTILFRLAELYLIRSEARVKQNKILGLNSAESDLNIIRNRAGLSNTIASTKEAMILAIERERQIELFSELGHRWFDLKRTNRSDAVLGIIKSSNWQSTDALFPIPLSEINLNPALIQNLGY